MARGLYGYPNTVEQPESDTVRPDLAADLPTVSDDGLTYTVTLREGLTFPDGSPVTSADVKATFEYMLDPNIQCATGGPPASGYYGVIEGIDAYSEALSADPAADAEISGITVVDDLTTEFKLVAEDGAFVRALAMGWSFIRPASTPRDSIQFRTSPGERASWSWSSLCHISSWAPRRKTMSWGIMPGRAMAALRKAISSSTVPTMSGP